MPHLSTVPSLLLSSAPSNETVYALKMRILRKYFISTISSTSTNDGVRYFTVTYDLNAKIVYYFRSKEMKQFSYLKHTNEKKSDSMICKFGHDMAINEDKRPECMNLIK